MDGAVRAIIEAIHASPSQAVLYVTGGASQALGWLMSVPGASNTVLEVLVPYSRTSMAQLLGKAIADACGATSAPILMLTESEVPYECERIFNEDQELEQLIEGHICMKIYRFMHDENNSNSERKIILSGSFNPLHEGHLKLLEVASSMYPDGYPCFEISAINADKPPLTVPQIQERVEQFKRAGKTVIISNQPYFYKKAQLFPGSVFVIGADTAARLIDPKYYGGVYERMVEILMGCKKDGCIFLVGGRNVNGVFKVLEDFPIPSELKGLFLSIPEEKFRLDMSSTEIREKLRKQTVDS